MSAVEFLNKLPAAFNAEAATDTNCVLQFLISEPVYATISGGTCTMTVGKAPNPDVSLTMEDDDLVQLLKGELNGMMAFMTGKLQVEGDLMLAQRISSFFDAEKLAKA